MGPIIDCWFVLTVAITGWMNREQSRALEYLLAENRVLKEQLKARGGRLRFTDKQRPLRMMDMIGQVVTAPRQACTLWV